MKALIFILLISLTLPLTSYQHNVGNDNDLETTKYLNFLAALKNISTFSYFTVIKVKNLNTGETKELCTKGNFVSGAIHKELHLDYDTAGTSKAFQFAQSKKDRYFEFKNKEALDNISFFEYKPNMVKEVQTRYNFDKAIKIIKSKECFGIRLSSDEMKAFAHVLFNKGYLTGENNCFGGALEYVDRSGIEDKR
jgi:hypothetical protein